MPTCTYLYLMSNTVESSSSSSSSFSGAISTRSAGVVIISYFRVFFNLFPDLEEGMHIPISSTIPTEASHAAAPSRGPRRPGKSPSSFASSHGTSRKVPDLANPHGPHHEAEVIILALSTGKSRGPDQ